MRALALLCFVPVIVQSYALVAAHDSARMNSPLAGADGVIWILLQIFCTDIGFMLFALVFGAGLKLHKQNRSLRRDKADHQQRRRLTALVALGLVFIFVLGADQTLLALGLTGLLTLRLIGWTPQKQIILGCVLIAGSAFAFATFAEILSARAPELMMEYGLGDLRSPIMTKPDVLALAQSGWGQHFLSRLQPGVLLVTGLVTTQLVLQGIGLALLGAAATERGMLTGNLAASRYVMAIAVGVGIGIPLSLLGILTAVSQAWEPPFLMGFGGLLKGAGSLLLTAASASFIALMFKRQWFRRGQHLLSRLGRSTLTWSILGLCFLAFYYHGYGLSQAGIGDRIAMMQFVVLIWILISTVSYFWLRYFHYGPCEWALRYWTYETRPPLARLDKIFAP